MTKDSNVTSERIMYLLASAGKTRNDLASFLNVSKVQVSRWTSGIRPIPKSRYKQIAEFFNMDPSQLDGSDSELLDIMKKVSQMQKDERAALAVYIINTLK